jgi:large subunit ribosomal protein L28
MFKTKKFKRYDCQVLGTKSVSGNSISHSNAVTQRWFRLNIHKHSFFSEILQKSIVFKCTTRAYRSVHKNGGIDKYILDRSVFKLTDELMQVRKILKKVQLKKNNLTTKTVTKPMA